MNVSAKHIVVVCVALLITILIGTKIMSDDTYPVVQAAVGERLFEVKARSTYGFDFTTLEDDLPTSIDEPVVFEYAGERTNEKLHFRLPPGRFVSIGQRAARIYSIKVSPQLEYLNLEDVYARSEEIADNIANAPGWKRTEHEVPTLERLRNYYSSNSSNRQALFGLWGAENTELSVTIKRAKQADTVYPEGYPENLKPEEDLFLVDVKAYNSELFFRYLEMMRTERIEQANDTEKSLPVEAYLKKKN